MFTLSRQVRAFILYANPAISGGASLDDVQYYLVDHHPTETVPDPNDPMETIEVDVDIGVEIPVPQNVSTFQVNVIAVNDSETNEGADEAIRVTLDPPDGVDKGSSQISPLIYLVDDHVAVEWADDSPTEVAEGKTIGVKLVASYRPHYRSDDREEWDIGIVTSNRTAKEYADYEPPTATLTFFTGNFSIDSDCNCYLAKNTVSIRTLQDTLLEGDETFTTKLLRAAGLHNNWILTSETQTITIDDDDMLDWELSLSSGGIVEVAESAAKLTIDTGGVTFTGAQTITLTIGGIATLTTDYTVSPADVDADTPGHQVTLPANARKVDITFTAVDDTTDDPNETITIDVAHGSDTIGSQQTITVIEGGLVELSTSATSVAEDGGSVSYTITATTAEDEQPTSDFELEISVSSADDTASAGDDYTAHSRAITFTRSDFSRQDISTDSSGDYRWVATDSAERIAISEDTLIEGDETFDLNLGAIDATTGFGAGQGTLTFTIEDNDEPDWTRSLDRKTIAESTTSAAKITIDQGSATFQRDQTIKLTLSGTASSADYTISPSDVSTDEGHQVTFPAGADTLVVTFTAVSDTDTAEDFTETILVDLSHDGSAIGERVSIKLTRKGLIGFKTRATIEGSESDGSFAYTVRAVTADDTQPATGYTASIKVSTVDDTATAGEDFTRLFKHVITFNRSDFSRQDTGGGDYRWVAEHTRSVAVIDDNIVEEDEQFRLLLSGEQPEADFKINFGSALLNIENDDEVDWVLSLSSRGIVEVAESAAKLTISTGGVAFSENKTFTLTIGGTAAQGTDYTVSPADAVSGTTGHQVVLEDGEEEVVVTFTAVDDTADDPNETITIDVALGSDTIGSQQTITVIEGGLVELSTSATSVAEDGGSISYTITATTAEDERPASDFELDISVSSADDTASAGDDYTTHSRAITFTRSDFSRQDISTDSSGDNRWVATDSAERIAISEDTLIEGDETFDLNLGAIDATTGFGAGQGTLTFTIEDDDEPDWTRSLDRKTIAEPTQSSAVITIDVGSVTFQHDQTIKLTLSGTASSGDYTIAPSDVSTDDGHQVTFPAGAQNMKVTFTAVLDTDTTEDFTETILVDLSHDGSAIGERVSIKLTDKGYFTLTKATIKRSESDGSFDYTIKAVTADDTQPATGYTASIKISTADGTATAGEDFTRLFNHRITFNRSDFSRKDIGGGDYRWVAEHTGSVAVIDDNIVEEDEELRLALFGEQPEADFKRDRDTTALTIRNDDIVSFSAVPSAKSISERASGASRVTISTGGVAFSDDKTFTLTIGGTAAQGTDYTVSPADAVSGTTGHQVVLEDGEEEVVVTFTAVNDTVDDPNETITVSVTLGGDAIGEAFTITVTEGGTVEILASTTTVRERFDGIMLYTIRATTGDDVRPAHNFTLAVTVNTADGTAVAGEDYTAHSATITLVRNDFLKLETSEGSGDYRWIATAERTFDIANDAVVEPDETFTIDVKDLDADTGFGVTEGRLDMTLVSDDRWALKAEASPTHIAEGDTEDVTLTVTTVNQDGETNSDDSCITPFAIDAEVDIADSGPQNAGAGTDYTYTEESENLHHLRLDSCESHGTVSLRIAATADDVDEGDERIVLTPGPYTSQDTSLYDGRWGEEAVVRIVDSTTRPQTTITLETVSPSDPEETTLTDGTAIGKFTIRVRFSEPVSDFTEGDIEWKTIANSTYDGVSISLRASNLIETVSQREYAIALVPNRSGVLVILIPGGAATSVAEDNGSKVKSVTVRIDMSANPAFSREVTENAAAGTALGGPVRFTDPPAGIDTYSLSGLDADRNAFTIDASTGQLRTKSGVTYDHETKNTYRVMVSGHSSADPMTRASVEVTIFVVADQLPPLAPGRPSVSKGTETNLDVSWSAPDNSGRPAISGYRTRYRVSPSGSWQSGPPTTGSTGAILTGLSATTRYDVQAQATNSAGDGPWSDSGSATTGSNIVNPPPPQDPTDPRIIVSSTAITVNEGNSGGQTYTVRLASKPSGNVTVTISGHAGTDLTVSSTSIPFSTTTWNSARAVRVTASHDGDTTNDSASLAHRGAGGGYDAASATVAVTVRDDDTANSPATGSPIITGVTSPLTVGTTLAASTSSIADSDGLTNPSYRYQWRRSRSDISGATGSTYTVRQADVGHTISVRVSFRDDSGHQESLASGPTAAVSDGEQNNDLPTLTLYADVTSISEGDFSRMRIDRAGSTTDRIETGLTCYDSGTDDTVLVAAIIGAGETSETTTAMHALDTSDSKTDRTITCRLNTAFNSVHNIGSPSSATVSVRD